jgi:hypothetical protein
VSRVAAIYNLCVSHSFIILQFEIDKMQFESLANELLLDVFEYFHVVHLFHAFYGLNLRFNQLLCTLLPRHHLDIRSISKHDFDNVSQQLPLIIDRAISLHLSNENTIPHLSKTLSSRHLSLDRFVRLQSLSLYDISSLDTMKEITCQCRCLPYLTHLHITRCSLDYGDRDISHLFNNIWSLSKLTYLNLHDIYQDEAFFSKYPLTSSSIKSLFMENISCISDDLQHLFKSLPHLRRLSLNIYCSADCVPFQTVLPSLISLKLRYIGSKQALISLFQTMPNLSYLTIHMDNTYGNGDEWERILVDYVPNIKLFQLKMTINSVYQVCNDQTIAKLLDSFRTGLFDAIGIHYV